MGFRGCHGDARDHTNKLDERMETSQGFFFFGGVITDFDILFQIISFFFLESSGLLWRVYFNIRQAVSGAVVFIIHESTHQMSCFFFRLTQSDRDCVCKWNSCPECFYFSAGEVKSGDLTYFIKKRKKALNYQTFFIVRALQPNVMPAIRGWESILSTWMFIFLSEKAIK